MTRQHTFVLLGLPSTGKTTFVAALWHAVQNASADHGMKLDAMTGDRSYLNEIEGSWLRGEAVPRTKVSYPKTASMRLVDTNTDQVGEFVFPDQAGENFESLWTDRQVEPELSGLIQDASGVLLFLHPDEITEPIRIDEASALVEEIDTDPVPAGQPEAPAVWNPRLAPTQVKTVGLLQELLHTRSGDTQFPLRVAIVISAWDLIVDTGQSVVTWIQERTPLLHQYLLANDDVIDSSFFGVSAQGASLEGENLEKLMSGRAAERAFVVNEQSNRHRDITEPLRWLVR